jgi:hypothetical protein
MPPFTNSTLDSVERKVTATSADVVAAARDAGGAIQERTHAVTELAFDGNAGLR